MRSIWIALAAMGFVCACDGDDKSNTTDDVDTGDAATDTEADSDADTEADADTDTDTDTDTAADADADNDTNVDVNVTESGGHRLYLGTGEYSPADDWHGILRFENAQDINSTVTPDGTVPVKQSGEDTDSSGAFDINTTDVRINFVHTLALDETRDEMYVGALFTKADNSNCGASTGNNPTQDSCGSIGVITDASGMDGSQTLSRHIFGSATQLNQPHGIWYDAARDILYAANTFGGNILVWDNAHTLDGDAAPDRVIDYNGTGNPVHLYVDGPTDRLFAVYMNPPMVVGDENASTRDGSNLASRFTIEGNNTRLTAGNNQTTHNVWFIASTETLIVGHHTNEVLFFDLHPLGALMGKQNLAPRVLEVQDTARPGGSTCADSDDANDWSTYGFYYVKSSDTLYVANGYTNGDCTHSGPPGAGGLKHVIRVYEGVSDASVSGVYPPSRRIMWSNAATYFPPQPLWVTEVP